MKEEKVMEEKIDWVTIDSRNNSLAEILKTKTKALVAHDCNGCSTRENAVFKVAAVGGKMAVGVGTGVCLGVGALVVAAVAEVAVPAILMFKALALTGGALGFLKGAKDFNKK